MGVPGVLDLESCFNTKAKIDRHVDLSSNSSGTGSGIAEVGCPCFLDSPFRPFNPCVIEGVSLYIRVIN